MAVVIPTGSAQVTFNWTHLDSSKIWATVLACDHGTVDPVDVQLTFLGAYNNNLEALLDNTVELTSITVREGPSTGPSPGLAVEFPVGSVGTNPMSGAPANCTLLVKKLTNLGGRANRGRNYWPGMVADGQVDEVGNIDPGIMVGLQSAFTGFFADIASGNGSVTEPLIPVILHDDSSPTTDPSTITAVQVQSVIGSQRRRVR